MTETNGEVVHFRHGVACPVCGGCEEDPRGDSKRCWGFISGEWIHCTREEHSGDCKFHPESLTYSHRLKGSCRCGVKHSPADPSNGKAKVKSAPECVYQYRDEDGRVVHETLRYRLENGDKTFRQRRPDGKGGYIWDLNGIAPVLYNLPAILAAGPDQPVWIVEGEKDVDRLVSLGLLATTNPMGALKWKDHYADSLVGRHCRIIPDNDKTGREHAQQVARSLHGKAASVAVVRLPGLAEKGDVSDFLSAGGTIEQLDDLDQEAKEWEGRGNASQDKAQSSVSDDPSAPVSPAHRTGIETPIPTPEWPDPPKAEAFHKLAGMIVREIEPSTEADPVGLLLQLLVGFGNAVGRGAWVEADGCRHHANEFAVVVGETSRARKGTSEKRVRPILACADPDWAAKKITHGLSSGEGLIWEIRDPILGTDKKTGQQIVVDPGVADKRVLVIESEFGGVLRVLREMETRYPPS